LNRCGSSKSANKTKDRAVNGTQLTQAGHSSIQIPFPEGYPSGIRQEEPLSEPGILCGWWLLRHELRPSRLPAYADRDRNRI